MDRGSLLVRRPASLDDLAKVTRQGPCVTAVTHRGGSGAACDRQHQHPSDPLGVLVGVEPDVIGRRAGYLDGDRQTRAVTKLLLVNRPQLARNYRARRAPDHPTIALDGGHGVVLPE